MGAALRMGRETVSDKQPRGSGERGCPQAPRPAFETLVWNKAGP